MSGSGFGYLIKQGVVNTWVNRMMSLASIGILTACLILVGGSGLLAVNIRDLFTAIESQNEVVVFVSDDATDAQIDSLNEYISSMEEVAESRFVTKEQALMEQKEFMGEQGYLLEGLEDDNPLPASFRVTLKKIEDMRQTVEKIQMRPGVDTISAPNDLADTLSGIEKTMLILGAVIIGILIVASAVVISNTIRLTLFARRREISIMRYVGATDRFIRMPFVVEGITIGVISAVLAFFLISSIYQSLGGLLAETKISWLSGLSGYIIPFGQLWYWVAGGFLLFGVFIGAFGSSASIRRYMRV